MSNYKGYIESEESHNNWLRMIWQYKNYPKRYNDYFDPNLERLYEIYFYDKSDELEQGSIKWYHKGKLEKDERGR